MKRLLIFLLLFPAIATVSFFSIIYILTGAVIDSFSGPALMYLFFIVPGLVLALVDWGSSKTRIPPLLAVAKLLRWNEISSKTFSLVGTSRRFFLTE